MIIDKNVAGEVFGNPCKKDYQPIFSWIDKKNGCIIYGGKNAIELFEVDKARDAIIKLDRAGKAKKMDYCELDKIEDSIVKSGFCVSNDPHVLALARISGTRFLCSKDVDLISDFGNLKILPVPHGKVYKGYQSVEMLRKDGNYHAAPCYKCL